MAGHSKWNNIKRRKEAQDSKRGKIFQKMSKEIFVAAKMGDPDPELNSSLRLAVDKAKAANMPNDNIDRAIKKAAGDLESVNYEEVTYEGYGPGGVAVMAKALTDNKNRTAANVRLAFSKNSGNLGENGCVSYMFDHKGLLIIDRDTTDIDEEEFMLEAIEAGAEEIEKSAEAFEIFTDPSEFAEVKKNLQENGFNFITAELTFIPQTHTNLDGEDRKKMEKLIDMLEDDDDVQEVYHNLEEGIE